MNNELLQFIDQQIFDLMQKKQEIMFKMANPNNNQFNLNNYGQYQQGGQPQQPGGNQGGTNQIQEGTKKTDYGSEETTFIRRKGKPTG